MIELVQFPWSPFCIVQRKILEVSGARFKIINVPNTDRALVWKLTRQRYYSVPIIKDGREVVFETDEHSQVIANYLDSKFSLGLFPADWEGVQDILWRFIENDIEGPCFKLNDIYFEEFVPAAERLLFLRHKERKFGRGCIDHWRGQRDGLIAELTQRLELFERALATRPYLLDARPRFVDFDLFGMLENFLYSGHYQLPGALNHLRDWHVRMSALGKGDPPREKLHP
jgi:glutathione S-transferase